MWRSLTFALGVLALVGCGRETWQTQPEMVRSATHANAMMVDLQKLSERPLTRFENGETLNGDDFYLINQSLPKARGLAAYQPNSFGTRVLLAKLLRASNQVKDAEEAYEFALGLAPSNPTPEQTLVIAACHSDLAAIKFGQRDLVRAEDELREALTLTPKNVQYMIQLVQVLLESKQKEAAKKELAEAEKLAPKSAGVKAMKQLLGLPTSSQGGEPSSSPKPAEKKAGSS